MRDDNQTVKKGESIQKVYKYWSADTPSILANDGPAQTQQN